MVAKQKLIIALNTSPAGSLLAPAELLPGCTGGRGYIRCLAGLRAGLIGAEKQAGAWRIPPFSLSRPGGWPSGLPFQGGGSGLAPASARHPQLLARVLPPGVGPTGAPHPIAGGRGGAAAAGGVLPPHACKLSGLLWRGPACGPLACGSAACG